MAQKFISERLRPHVTYETGEYALHADVQSVGLILSALKAWKQNIELKSSEDTVVVVQQDGNDVSSSTGALIFESSAVQEALQHSYNISDSQTRSRTSEVLAQLILAEDKRQHYFEKADIIDEATVTNSILTTDLS